MNNIILIGAGWTGISSLWFLFTQLWYKNIIGIDSAESQITNALIDSGVRIIIGHGEYQVLPWDLVIYSDACPHAPEVEQAQVLMKQEIKGTRQPLSYFQFLGEVSKLFETISIAGTHGKSTTTAMLTYAMSKADSHFAIGILGALVPQLDNKNYWINPALTTDIHILFTYLLTGKHPDWNESLRKKYRFVIEADEFNRHFLYLDTDYAIILNAELDHSDIYPNEQIYLETFIEFMNKVKKRIFVLPWEKWIDYLLQHWPNTVKQVDKKEISLNAVFGDHVQKNASLNEALLQELWIENHDLWTFKGLRRRMELLTILPSWAPLYTDYWHHPTELAAVYSAFREKFPGKRLVTIFQPHQARRVLEFWEEFAAVMQSFDEVIIYDIYTAREDLGTLLEQFPLKHDIPIDSITTLGNLFAKDCNGIYTQDFDVVTNRINEATSEEVLCIFSAGNLDFKLRNYLEEA